MVFKGIERKGTQNTVARNFKGGELYWILDDVLIALSGENNVDNFTFQQDNAPSTANKTKQFLTERSIDVLEIWTLSPDLNPTENLCGTLSNTI